MYMKIGNVDGVLAVWMEITCGWRLVVWMRIAVWMEIKCGLRLTMWLEVSSVDGD